MDGNTNSFGIRGFLIDTPEFGALRGRPTGALIIDNGRITERGDYDDLRRVQRRTPIRWIDHGNAAIFPGLIALGKAGIIGGTLDAGKEAARRWVNYRPKMRLRFAFVGAAHRQIWRPTCEANAFTKRQHWRKAHERSPLRSN